MAKYEIVYNKDLEWVKYGFLAKNNFEAMLLTLWKFSKENEDIFKEISQAVDYKNINELICKTPYEPTPRQKKIFDIIAYQLVNLMVDGDFRIQYIKNADSEICIFGEDPDIKNGKGNFIQNKENFENMTYKL